MLDPDITPEEYNKRFKEVDDRFEMVKQLRGLTVERSAYIEDIQFCFDTIVMKDETLLELNDLAMNVMQEIKKAEVGGLQHQRFQDYFEELYGKGLEITNWHKNGETESFDAFYDAAIKYAVEEKK